MPLKTIADEALAESPSIEHVLVLRRTESECAMRDGRDLWWHEEVARQSAVCAPESMDAEDLLFILYTSGTTGKPKGIMHTTGGYLTQVAYTHKYVFDLKPDTDVLLVHRRRRLGNRPLVHRVRAAREPHDVGALRGHPRPSGQGPLVVDRREVQGDDLLHRADRDQNVHEMGRRSSRRARPLVVAVIGTVGEPINPEAWVWYYGVIGGARCPVVDTWWQTETGLDHDQRAARRDDAEAGQRDLSRCRGSVPTSSTTPACPVGIPGGGYLVLSRPWPSMLRGIWGDAQRYRDTYWSRFGDRYFAGDGAKRDDDGYFWLLGRVDDIMLVAGHNISTTEVESALVDHPAVAEAAVVGRNDATTGQAIAAFVTLRGGFEPRDELVEELRNHVAELIGPIAKPKTILFTEELPKTRSGKIMRRLLRNVAEDERLGDTTTLADPTVVDGIKSRYLASQPPEE